VLTHPLISTATNSGPNTKSDFARATQIVRFLVRCWP